MKGSTLSSILYTVAFSLGTSLASTSPLEKRSGEAVSWFDEPGLRNRVLQCDQKFFTKIVSYATVNHALTSGNGKGRKRWCRSGMCITFPAPFNNKQTLFRVQGPYKMFPIKPDGTLYNGGNPGSDFVVFNENAVVAGVIKKGPLSYSKCLYNDQISPPGTPFMTRMWTKFNEFPKNPFARKSQEGTSTMESARAMFNKHNPFAKKNQQDGAGNRPQEGHSMPMPPPAYEA